MKKGLVILGFFSSLLTATFSFAGILSNAHVDDFTLKLVNDSQYTLHISKVLAASNTTLPDENWQIKPNQTVYIHAKALVSPSIIKGLGATLVATINGHNYNLILMDQALGWAITPYVGFSQANPLIHSSDSNPARQNPGHNYDISWSSLTLTLTNQTA